MQLDPRSPLPLYQQFKRIITQRVAQGEWLPNQPIPPERELTSHYGVSRTTVRLALADLVNEGWLYRVQGKGTFVAPPKVRPTLGELTGFAEELKIRGLDPEIRVVEYKTVPPPPAAAETLQVPPGEEVLAIKRLVLVQGVPYFADQSYLAGRFARFLSPEKVAQDSIYRTLEAAGQPLLKGQQTIEAAMPDRELMQLMQLPRRTPVLVIRRTTLGLCSEPVEHAQAWFRGDRYQYKVDLRRTALISAREGLESRPINF